MMQMRARQEGLTLGGLMFVLAIIGAVVTFAVRAFPLYNEKMQVVSALNSVVSHPDSASLSDSQMRSQFLKNMYATTNIRRFDDKNVKEYITIEKPKVAGEPKVLHLKYESRNKLVYDLDLLLVVDQQFPVRGNEGGE